MNMEKQELIAEIATAALAELDKMEKGRIQVSSPKEIVKKVFEGMRDPQPVVDFIPDPTTSSPQPTIAPEFPRVLVDYKAGEYMVVSNFADWAPLHHWSTVFPPQQPASRPITTTLELEIEKLKAQGVKERPREEWQRRRQRGPSNLWWETGRSF